MASLRPILRDLAGSVVSASHRLAGRWPSEMLTIITFHRVLTETQRSEYPLAELAVTPEELRWIVERVAASFRLSTMRAAFDRPSDTRPTLVITFDDGQRDNFENARPILNELGVPATFFVPVHAVQCGQLLWHDRAAYALARLRHPSESQLLGGRGLRDAIEIAKGSADEREAWIASLHNPMSEDDGVPEWDGMMTWDQLGTLVDEGHEVGSHSMYHAILPLCGDRDLADEVEGSRRILEECLSTSVDSFCYPNGDCDARTMRAVRNAGYARAVTTLEGNNQPDAPAYSLRRFDMQSAHIRDRHGNLSEDRLIYRLKGAHTGTLRPGRRG